MDKFKEYENIEKQIELKENDDNKEKQKLEEDKEEDNQKKIKFEHLHKLISEKSAKEKEMKKNDEILLDIKQKDYLEMVKDKKLRELLEKYGGGFGKVWKVLYKKLNISYAMKEMSKAKIIDKRSEKGIKE